MQTVIQRWYDLINIDSVNGHEVNAARYIAAVLEGFGLEVHWSHFAEDKDQQRPSLWTVLDSGRPGPTMMLIGHMDTVGVNLERWNTNPFQATEIDGLVYGRGSMDMKGGLSCILSTFEHFCSHRDEFTGKILGCFVSDEEGLSKGSYQLVSEGVFKADYAIMAEGRYDNVAVGFRGRYSFDVTVRGRAAHASKYPAVGESALINAGRMAQAIEALPTLTHPHLKHGTWCVRYIEGGNMNALVVPDSCYLFVDRYVVPGEDDRTCIAQMQEAAESIGLGDKVDIKLRPRVSPYMKSFAVPEDHALVQTLRSNFTGVVGSSLRIDYDPSVCDSNILAAQGIPVVTFGPSGGNMHGDNEYGVPEQVTNCLEIYIRTVRDMLQAR